MATDVTVEHEVQRLIETAVDEFGRLDGALNNAGGVNATAPLLGVDSGSGSTHWSPATWTRRSTGT